MGGGIVTYLHRRVSAEGVPERTASAYRRSPLRMSTGAVDGSRYRVELADGVVDELTESVAPLQLASIVDQLLPPATEAVEPERERGADRLVVGGEALNPRSNGNEAMEGCR